MEGKKHIAETSGIALTPSSITTPAEETNQPVEKTPGVEASFEEVVPQVEDTTVNQAGIAERSPVVVVETPVTTSKSGQGHIVKSAALVSINCWSMVQPMER